MSSQFVTLKIWKQTCFPFGEIHCTSSSLNSWRCSHGLILIEAESVTFFKAELFYFACCIFRWRFSSFAIDAKHRTHDWYDKFVVPLSCVLSFLDIMCLLIFVCFLCCSVSQELSYQLAVTVCLVALCVHVKLFYKNCSRILAYIVPCRRWQHCMLKPWISFNIYLLFTYLLTYLLTHSHTHTHTHTYSLTHSLQGGESFLRS